MHAARHDFSPARRHDPIARPPQSAAADRTQRGISQSSRGQKQITTGPRDWQPRPCMPIADSAAASNSPTGGRSITHSLAVYPAPPRHATRFPAGFRQSHSRLTICFPLLDPAGTRSGTGPERPAPPSSSADDTCDQMSAAVRRRSNPRPPMSATPIAAVPGSGTVETAPVNVMIASKGWLASLMVTSTFAIL